MYTTAVDIYIRQITGAHRCYFFNDFHMKLQSVYFNFTGESSLTRTCTMYTTVVDIYICQNQYDTQISHFNEFYLKL